MYRYFIQPELNKMTQSLIGYELLIKIHTDQGWRPPECFAKVPVREIADRLVETTAKLVLKVGSVSVNLNRVQMVNPLICEALIKSQHQLRPLKLNVELTEQPTHIKISDEQLLPVIKKFTDRGMEVCLDDVGTGENSMTAIQPLLPYASEIKFALQNFDADFQDPEIQALVVKWRDFAAERHLRFILEGIENEADDQLADALDIGVRQGYYYGKPHLVKLNKDDPE
ncbi:hypothetical protein C5L31_001172 [Secundilactobacillus malefermentans]|uniref:EAL domain-containing protein n=1 Tax=Secundilactobacillus malefermentans TaxID=176292 RepID=A0A4V3A3B1_9LACO|nr:EAL domain-containing protein [Secundilactobacillus malefermentans]TDG73908.1 hypothetical protein C5L31_001172 [Secundilactobacillus malefermentans]